MADRTISRQCCSKPASRGMKRASRVTASPPSRNKRVDLFIYCALFVLVSGAYFQVHSFDFIKYDDPEFVVDNVHLRSGLTLDAIRWAMTSLYAANWFPLTWISYMLGYRVYGLNSGWHHLTNVALHVLNTLLLFGILKRMTGARWRSAFVAFAFGLHPMHVEPVAWIAERKEVLSGLFWFLTIWTYLSYLNKPGIYRYLLVVLAFSGGLMSKPMIVTLPFVLLLLDLWPLKRWGTIPTRRIILEKVPLLALSAGVSVISFLAQKSGGAVSSLALIPLSLRIQNAVVSYAIYVLKFLWPGNLSIIYPFDADFPKWQVVAAILALSLATIAALRRPFIIVGWLWFLGTLVPVIGFIQVGAQSRADRYTYIPFIGLSIIAAWGLGELSKMSKQAAIAVAVVVSSAWFAITVMDVGYWRNSIAIFEHAVQVTNNNWMAQTRLAQGLLFDGRVAEAIPYLEESLRLNPDDPESHVILGEAFSKSDKLGDASKQFAAAVRLRPDDADAQEGLGMVFTDLGRLQEARSHLLEAIRLRPDDADSHYNLGRLYGLSGQADHAIAQFAEAVRLKPNDAAGHYNLATALAVAGHVDQACDQFRIAMQLKPDYAEAHLSLARLLASVGRCKEAVVELQEVLRLDPDSADARELLARCSY